MDVLFFYAFAVYLSSKWQTQKFFGEQQDEQREREKKGMNKKKQISQKKA